MDVSTKEAKINRKRPAGQHTDSCEREQRERVFQIEVSEMEKGVEPQHFMSNTEAKEVYRGVGNQCYTRFTSLSEKVGEKVEEHFRKRKLGRERVLKKIQESLFRIVIADTTVRAAVFESKGKLGIKVVREDVRALASALDQFSGESEVALVLK